MGYTAADIMSKEVLCVTKDADLRDLAKLFLAKRITGAPVLDRNGDLCGVISQTDLLFYQLSRDDELVVTSDFYQSARVEGRSISKGFQIEDVNTAKVEEVMTPVVHAVVQSASVESVVRLMTRRHIHRVIVRRGRKVVGIISALDVLRVFGGQKVKSKPRVKAKARVRVRARRRTSRARRHAA